MPRRRLLAATAALMVVVAACGGDDDVGAGATDETTVAPPADQSDDTSPAPSDSTSSDSTSSDSTSSDSTSSDSAPSTEPEEGEVIDTSELIAELIAPIPATAQGTLAEELLTTTKANEEYSIAIMVPNLQDPLAQVLAERGKAYAETVLGAKAEIHDAGGYGFGVEQAQQVDDVVQRGVDGIVLWAADSAALGPAVERAADAGIPTVSFFSGESSGRAVTLVSNNLKLVGEMMCESLADAPPRDEPLNIVMLVGQPAAETAVLRAEGFRECASEAGYTILAERNSEATRDAAAIEMDDLIQQFGDEIDVVYNFSSFMALGSLDTLNDRGVEVGYDNDGVLVLMAAPERESAEHLKEGRIFSAIDQAPSMISTVAVAALVHALNGGELPDHTEVPLTIIPTTEAADYNFSWVF